MLSHTPLGFEELEARIAPDILVGTGTDIVIRFADGSEFVFNLDGITTAESFEIESESGTRARLDVQDDGDIRFESESETQVRVEIATTDGEVRFDAESESRVKFEFDADDREIRVETDTEVKVDLDSPHVDVRVDSETETDTTVQLAA